MSMLSSTASIVNDFCIDVSGLPTLANCKDNLVPLLENCKDNSVPLLKGLVISMLISVGCINTISDKIDLNYLSSYNDVTHNNTSQIISDLDLLTNKFCIDDETFDYLKSNISIYVTKLMKIHEYIYDIFGNVDMTITINKNEYNKDRGVFVAINSHNLDINTNINKLNQLDLKMVNENFSNILVDVVYGKV
ncbi:hypothetical protein [Veillonella sp.]